MVTTERVIHDDEASSITITTSAGEITILPHHTSLISVIKAGEITIRKGNEQATYAIAGGILEIRPGSSVIALIDAVEHVSAIDMERAQDAYDRATQAMKEKVEKSDVDYARLEAYIEKNLNRVRTAQKYRK